MSGNDIVPFAIGLHQNKLIRGTFPVKLLSAYNFSFEIDLDQLAIAERLDVSRPAVSEMVHRMQAEGLLSEPGARGLKAEAETRIAENRFYGFMSYLSLIATKPG